MPAAAAFATVASAAISASSARSAANAQQRGAQRGIDEQGRQFDLIREDTAPSREVGRAALYRLADYLGLDVAGRAPEAPNRADFTKVAKNAYSPSTNGNYSGPMTVNSVKPIFDQTGFDAATQKYNSDLEAYNSRDKDPRSLLEQDPGFKFRLDQGNKALDRAQSAGRVTGGRAIKEAMRYGQDYASGEYGNSMDRLFRLAGFGTSGTSQSAAAGSNAANQIGQYSLAAGNAAAQGYANQNNAYQGAIDNFMTLGEYNNWWN